jgi:hypothetical protein
MRSFASANEQVGVTVRAGWLAAGFSLVVWLVGLVAYAIIQRILGLSGWRPAAFWSAVGSWLLLPLSSVPALLDRGARRLFQWRLTPVWGLAMAVVAVALVGGASGQHAAASSALVTWACFGGMAAVAFGGGYAAGKGPTR